MTPSFTDVLVSSGPICRNEFQIVAREKQKECLQRPFSVFAPFRDCPCEGLKSRMQANGIVPDNVTGAHEYEHANTAMH